MTATCLLAGSFLLGHESGHSIAVAGVLTAVLCPVFVGFIN